VIGVDRVLGVDWSGAVKRRDQQIYIAELVRNGGKGWALRSLARAADRDAVGCFLYGQRLDPADGWADTLLPEPPTSGETVLAGLDFAFGFPVSFKLPGVGQDWAWEELVAWCAKQDKAEKLDQALRADPVASKQFRLPGGLKVKTTNRETEAAAVGQGHHPESVLNLVGGRQVGRGSIRGLPIIGRLREPGEVAVWPFDPAGESSLTLVEVFPRISLTVRGSKEDPPNRVAQLAAWRDQGLLFERQTDYLAAASPDGLDAVAAAFGLATLEELAVPAVRLGVLSREGWIAGIHPPR
jgi:hypothetical protein